MRFGLVIKKFRSLRLDLVCAIASLGQGIAGAALKKINWAKPIGKAQFGDYSRIARA
jgi:hypothetical protein